MVSALEMQEAEDCIDRLNEKIAALKAENEHWRSRAAERCLEAEEWFRKYGEALERAEAAERALAERAGGVKVRHVLVEAREFVSAVFGENQPARSWAYELRGKIDIALSALTTEPAAPAGRQEAVALPPYGKMPFDELGRDVSEAGIGVRRDFDFGETYPGHVMTGINFNSLNRIVSKYATRPSEQAVTEAGKGLLRIVEEIDGAINHGTWRDENGMRLKDTPEWVAFYNALKAAMEAGRHE